MNILFIAPIPPPTDGQSKASKALLDILIENNHIVRVVNLRKTKLQKSLIPILRIGEILSVLIKVWANKKNNDIIYLSLAESFLGNLRDIFIYAICYKQNSRIFIHMLGGAGMKKILERKNWMSKINHFFIKRIGGVIVEGSLNRDVYSKIIAIEKIHIVPNFAEDYLFVSDEEIEVKYENFAPVKILYLSNLINGKGYDELVDAYIALDNEIKKNLKIEFVGGFETIIDKKNFLLKIKNFDNLKYLGSFIDGAEKRQLFGEAHVFCLPTYYPFEGQPISILEAYASGCCVITTNHSGIPFVFSDKKNGFLVEKKSINSLRIALEVLHNKKSELKEFSFANRNQARHEYRVEGFQNSIHEIFRSFVLN